ncbi:MAG: hypothetical protein RIK87_30870 [Fuerstiella sp.]
MRDPRINFRSRELAALLAFLIPGAGHCYQGRTLKAGIYFTCILSLFFAGMVLGDWQPVYSQVAYSTRADSLQLLPREARVETSFSIGYGAQVFTGLPALPALIQQARFASDEGVVRLLNDDIDSDFVGILRQNDVSIPVSGRLQLSAADAGLIEGHMDGSTPEGTPVSVDLSGSIHLGRKVFGSPRKEIKIHGLSGIEIDGIQPDELKGTVSRPFLDWFQAPRDNDELDRLHGKLSQDFDIACVFTWIAGLLNLMAIWDAYDGPAYGYGDEEPEDDDDDESSPD